MLGYFSLVGLLRLHSLLGDFYQAIKVLFIFIRPPFPDPVPVFRGFCFADFCVCVFLKPEQSMVFFKIRQ
jgi:hypothetical protein